MTPIVRSARVAAVLALTSALVVGLFAATVRPAAAAPNGDTLDTHAVQVDSGGKLVSWLPADQAYGQVSKLSWDYLLDDVPTADNGQPAYLSHSYLDSSTLRPVGWPHNPAGLYAMLTESALRYYQYSGDARVLAVAERAVKQQLSSGLTAASDSWSKVPYASGDSGSLTYRGAEIGNSTGSGDGVGVIQPDKVGEFGNALVQLYKMTGNQAYLNAAQDCADALASHLRTGSATQSPWPFRVVARTNATRVENYGANVTGSLELFDGLVALKAGDTAAYARTRSALLAWTLAYPVKTNNWSGYFEDVEFHPEPGDNLNQYDAMMFARYLLENPSADPSWETHVRGLLAWVKRTFGDTTLGATTIREQLAFNYAMGSHTARYASVNALLYEKTGDTAALEEAYRSFNWATYMARSNGVVIDGPDVNNVWFTDGYGDYVRHFMVGMGALPQYAPNGQTHLLETTSTITKVGYGANLTYTAYDNAGTEKIKTPDAPASVTVDGKALAQGSAGWSYDSGRDVLTVRRSAGRSVVVALTAGSGGSTPNVAPTVALTSPDDGSSYDAPASVAVAATADDSDGRVTKVELLVDGKVSATDTTAPYAATVSGLAAGSHTFSARATDDDGATTTSDTRTVTVLTADAGGAPSTGWRGTDVGPVGVAGTDSASGGTVTVKASGTDIWGTEDAFRFRYLRLGDDGTITAQVASQSNTDPWALAGVMLRSSLDADAAHVLLALTPDHGLSLDHRLVAGSGTDYRDAGDHEPPTWVRLTRSGTTVVAYASTNGTSWTEVGRTDVDLGSDALAGLAVTSHVNTRLGTAVFAHVTTTASASTTPTPVPPDSGNPGTPTSPPVPSGLPDGIEPLATTVGPVSCDPALKAGVRQTAALLKATYAGTTTAGPRGCAAIPGSEYYDGRALDWQVSARSGTQVQQARSLTDWLLATDEAGNPYANARRLGVTAVVWNNKVWRPATADRGWLPWSTCASHPEKSWDSTCRRDRMQLTFSWEGAQARTSFWSRSVAAIDYGPCRPADLRWAAAYTSARSEACPRYAAPATPKGASSTYTALLTYSGMTLRSGTDGAAVKVVQGVVGVKADGVYSSATGAAVKKWQGKHGVGATGVVDPATWRALLKDKRPR